MLNPALVAQKWKRGLQNAGQSYTEGINAVTESPMEKAAAAADKYARNVQAAVQSGKYAANLRRVPMSTWKQQSTTKGAANLTAAAENATPKFQNFMGEFLPYVANVQSQVRAMPNNTKAEAIARMVRNVELMSEFKRSGG